MYRDLLVNGWSMILSPQVRFSRQSQVFNTGLSVHAYQSLEWVHLDNGAVCTGHTRVRSTLGCMVIVAIACTSCGWIDNVLQGCNYLGHCHQINCTSLQCVCVFMQLTEQRSKCCSSFTKYSCFLKTTVYLRKEERESAVTNSWMHNCITATY